MALIHLEEVETLHRADLGRMLRECDLTPEQSAAIADQRVERGADRFDEYFGQDHVEDLDWRPLILDAIKHNELAMASADSCVAGVVFNAVREGDGYHVALHALELGGRAPHFGLEADWLVDYSDLHNAWTRYLRKCNQKRIDELRYQIMRLDEVNGDLDSKMFPV